MSKSIKKKAILKSAESLFYNHGFHAVGMKRVIEEANVAGMTVYNHFTSKERLIEEVLKQCEIQYWNYLHASVEKNPRTPFLQIVKGHGKWMNEKGKNGCMFLRALEEYADTDNQIEAIVRNHKNDLFQYIESIALKQGLTQCDTIASQIMLLLEGATSSAEIFGPEKAEEQAIYMLESLLLSWRIM
ncbi:TetR/AcrR family transcriptional regulator [Ornithinibacillus gellani]|uniref:TetR/AcrR family transcriptional regulator n=1 Tax=Ornithinibacillus gellani TaxID=2293253 RepID=UPI000F472991|nr:TetR/AcrR family transcriptional regulator [Ornithinibacillus gellani]TQS71834.1 TetR/AcrR family transcriptional regulator [Ornithinibacillus gellani]